MHSSVCSLRNTPHYNDNFHSKCIPQKVTTHVTPTPSSETPDMTHTFTTGTADSAVMGTGEEEIPHLQSIVVHWGKGLPVCTLLDLQLMTHNVTYCSTFLHEATPTLPTKHSNLIKHYSCCMWQNTNTTHLHRQVPHSGRMCWLHFLDRRKVE